MRPAWPPWPNIGNRSPAHWPLGSAGADAAQPWLGQPSLRAEEQVDGVRRKPRDPHPSLPQGDWGPLLSLSGRGEVAFHPVPLSHREACRARPGDSVSCRSSCRSSRGGFWGGGCHQSRGGPPRKAWPPTLEYPLWGWHAPLGATPGAPVLPGTGRGQRAHSGPVGWLALHCLLHTGHWLYAPEELWP